MKCPKCHNKIDDDAVFCEFCGADIKSARNVPPAVIKTVTKRKKTGTIAAFVVCLAAIAVIVVFAIFGTVHRVDEEFDSVFTADSTIVTEGCDRQASTAEDAGQISLLSAESTETKQVQPQQEPVKKHIIESRSEEPIRANAEVEQVAEEKAAEIAARQREEKKTLYYNAANCLYIDEQYEEAVANFRRAAEFGSTAAASMLGYCYFAGKGVSKNPIKALEWWRSAAADNHAYSIYMIGYCYYSGTGVEQNFDEALAWMQRAESLGFADAREIIDDIARISAGQ